LLAAVCVLVAPAGAAPTTTAVAFRGELGPPRLLTLIRKHFPNDAKRAICVARYESSLRPAAYSRGNYGLFQINWTAHSHLDRSRLLQAAYNVRAARRIYLDAKRRFGNGWLPWSVRGLCGA
jgi:hypothetical protein